MGVPRMVNLGCGDRTHPSWINVDYSPLGAMKLSWFGQNAIGLGLLSPLPINYVNYDLRRGVPFDSASVDVVYMSHVLEHIDRRYVAGFLQEVRRVLRPGGLIRISVPDLERIANNYLKALLDCRADPQDEGAAQRYYLAMLALFDQMVRTTPGGELIKYYAAQTGRPPSREKLAFLTQVKRRIVSWIVSSDPGKTGELHRWMYDDYSLGRLLHDAGFAHARRTSYDKSAVPEWMDFRLDNNPDGTEYKPGSLYFEAIKPP